MHTRIETYQSWQSKISLSPKEEYQIQQQLKSKQMNCKNCQGRLIKNGKQQNGTQRYKCKDCKLGQQEQYLYKAYKSNINTDIVRFLKEGLGILSISRLCIISPTTVIDRILKIANNIQPPMLVRGKSYEVDELCTYVGNKNKRRWICYALRKDNREVVRYSIGTRTKNQLNKVISTLELSEAKVIYTDGLRIYQDLIQVAKHKFSKANINHIERKNLTLRTHLKRLNRRTICFSKKRLLLDASLKIYFWG